MLLVLTRFYLQKKMAVLSNNINNIKVKKYSKNSIKEIIFLNKIIISKFPTPLKILHNFLT